MKWPWQSRREHRASFTDALVNAFFVGATGTTARDAHETAALEACVSLYSSCFAVAKVEPMVEAVTPATLALIARNMIRQGADLHLIALEDGMVKLRPVGTWHVIGPPDPAAWRYRVDTFGPTDHVTRYVPAAAVLHFMYAVDPVKPWLGIPPLGWASATASLAGGLERDACRREPCPGRAARTHPGRWRRRLDRRSAGEPQDRYRGGEGQAASGGIDGRRFRAGTCRRTPSRLGATADRL